jgi:hypothetical protein
MRAMQGRSPWRLGFLTRSTRSGGSRIGFCVPVMALLGRISGLESVGCRSEDANDVLRLEVRIEAVAK